MLKCVAFGSVSVLSITVQAFKCLSVFECNCMGESKRVILEVFLGVSVLRVSV